MSIFDSFTRRNSLIKTLRFRLEPMYGTREQLAKMGVLERDQERSESWETVREALRRVEKDSRFIAFSLLHENRTGLVELDQNEQFPALAGYMVRHCIKPELQGKGYSDQLLGYAIHTFRLMGKHGVVLDPPKTSEEVRVAHRFVVSEMEGFPDYLYLNTDVPSLPEPTLA